MESSWKIDLKYAHNLIFISGYLPFIYVDKYDYYNYDALVQSYKFYDFHIFFYYSIGPLVSLLSTTIFKQ